DKLRGRGAAHDPTAWFAKRTTLGLSSYCLTTCTYSDGSEFVPGMTGDHPNTFRIASVSSVILTLSDGLLRGPSTKRAKRTNRLADKLRGRGAAHDPTAWFAERTTLGLSSYCLTTCTYSD